MSFRLTLAQSAIEKCGGTDVRGVSSMDRSERKGAVKQLYTDANESTETSDYNEETKEKASNTNTNR